MMKEMDCLIGYLEKYKLEIETELLNTSDNQFLDGKAKGIQHALTICRVYNQPEEKRNSLDIEIDTTINVDIKE
jgi:hypothetical protein